MKKLFLSAALFAVTLTASAQDSPLWMRHCAISPDGKTIAFSYMGHLFTVPSEGGRATQLTTQSTYDSYPVWSPDGKHIAFASNRKGGLDVWVIAREGGAPRRLTTHSAGEVPTAFLNDTTILYKASIMPVANSSYFPGSDFYQIYRVGIHGGRPRLFSAVNMDDISINKKGDVLYHDKKGYEDTWRKHHQSPITRDIWLQQGNTYRKLTSFAGEDRNPVWAKDGKSFYYLSEQSGSFNVFKRSVESGNSSQLTRFSKNPVRFLSSSADGTLCFGYDGELYTMREGEKPRKVNVKIVTDLTTDDVVQRVQRYGATEAKASPNGKEVAFVLHGDVYVTSVDYATTKRVTDTPEQERSIDFAPDGLSITYASERDGLWQIYLSSIKNANEKLFTYATDLKKEQLTNSKQTSFQPLFSPDGKSIAFLENRGTLKAVDVKSHKVRTLMDGKYIFSYSDGDVDYEWSPDSRWLLSNYIGKGGWQSDDVALVNASGNGEIHNLTNSGYKDSGAKWALGGKAMLFKSDRAGYRSHGSWGAEQDAYLMFFDQDAYDRFQLNKEERALYDDARKAKEEEERAKEVANGKKKDGDKKGEKSDKKSRKDTKAKDEKAADKKSDDKKDDKKKEPLKLDLDNCRDRIVRLTVNSSRLGDCVLSNDGNVLYYQAAFEGGADLWKHDLVENRTEIVMKGIGWGNMYADKDFKSLYMLADGNIRKYDVGSRSVKNISYEAPFNYRPFQERQYMFDHVWREVKDKFYDPKLHGVDWEGYRKTYERYLPYINNNYDFAEMLSEMLGELNASHTGGRYQGGAAPQQTANLGLFFDDTWKGDGLRVQEVLKRGPFAVRPTGVTAGCVIEKINGEPILRGTDYYPMLNGKAGKMVRVAVFNPKTKKRFEVEVKPVGAEALSDLLYKRWVDHNRHLVDSLSHGRLAYVHVKAMNSESFRTVYSDLLNDTNRNREAAIVDDRHNGGGWLHDDLCTLLSGKQYQTFVPQGKTIGVDPFNKWTKPSCVLICEDDYSNGHGFPWVYKTLGIGKLIGAPVAGTMTAVWWERLIDNTMVFGIPQVGCVGMDGRYGENNTLHPDIEVYNSPEDYLNGNDEQLKTAVQEMLREVSKKK